MNRRKDQARLMTALEEIVRKYDQLELTISSAYGDGGLDPLWPRFKRAGTNQIEDGESTVSRYAIWANTVRDNIVEAMKLLETEDDRSARDLLVRSANSLSAFSDLQALLDPWKKAQDDL